MSDIRHAHLKDLLKEEGRFETLSLHLNGFLADFSKQRIDLSVIEELIHSAEKANLSSWIDKLFNGEKINHTENRAAWHTALRDLSNPQKEVSDQWSIMESMVHKIHSKQWRGFSGDAIKDVVCIGVGGSDLGPLMTVQALELNRHPNSPELHFVSTLDGRQIHKILNTLRPETTLFIIASKSFTTIDTLSLAQTAQEWVMSHTTQWQNHFIGVSTNTKAMNDWGITQENQLQFWDWVGGRYSMWSAIGISIALWLGMDGFKQLLEGAHAMDEHFRATPFKNNIPVWMGLIGHWNNHTLGIKDQAILPYDERLKKFPSYLEQLEMESNGKSVQRDGKPVQGDTCPILWGEVGPNAQHAFYQLLHQGTRPVMSDFIVCRKGVSSDERGLYHQQLNIANCLAQSRALAIGQDNEDPHRCYPGNQPSTTLILPELNAYYLGMLIALYEHKVFVQSVIWNINPFDQWGVELGKMIAKDIFDAIDKRSFNQYDSSTTGLLTQLYSDSPDS